MNMASEYSFPHNVRTSAASAYAVLSVMLLIAVAVFGCWLVGTRSLETGTDTSTYATFFERLAQGPVQTRLEPGFVSLSYALNRLGLGVIGYQVSLFALLLLIAAAAARGYFKYLGGTRGYLTFLSACVMLLFLSPMFVNGSINAVRQGLAALLVFSALLSFQHRKWAQFIVYGALAVSLHYSSALYLLFAPALFLRTRWLRLVAAAAFLAYVSGLSMALVQAVVPGLYALVMEYTANAEYRSGVRIDFAVFSIFWYLLPHMASPLIRQPYRERIKESTAAYLVMLLPFFSIGWGFFSNRYLLPAWLSISLIIAAMLYYNRSSILRNPLLIRLGLIGSCAIFYIYVTNVIVI